MNGSNMLAKPSAMCGNMWGAEQTVRGPFIIVPTIKRRQVKKKG